MPYPDDLCGRIQALESECRTLHAEAERYHRRCEVLDRRLAEVLANQAMTDRARAHLARTLAAAMRSMAAQNEWVADHLADGRALDLDWMAMTEVLCRVSAAQYRQVADEYELNFPVADEALIDVP